MGKELKSCTGVLWRADLAWSIGRFLPKRVGWPCHVRSALKRMPVQDFNRFSIMICYIISTTYQNIGDLFYCISI